MDTSPADSTNYTGERPNIDGKPLLNKNNSCNSSSSSTSSDSSDGDFFQLDPAELDKPMQPGGIHETQLPAQQQIRLSMTNAAVVAAGHDQDKPAAGELGGPTQSPQVQVMGRSVDVHDPNRIPSSIFDRTKSTAQMEWSVASNESLFSIHMGNSSFSRDHAFLLGSPPPGPPFSPASRMPSSSLPPLSPGPRSASRIDQVQPQPQPQPHPTPLGTTEAANAEAMKDLLRAAAEEHDDSGEKNKASGDLINNSARLSRQSDGSATSFRSFAFPILTGEGRSGSVKGELPAEQKSQRSSSPKEDDHDKSEQQQTPKAESPAAAAATAATEAKGWLACFSCCPFCR